MSAPSNDDYPLAEATPSAVREDAIEFDFIGTLQGLKYEYRRDIRDRAALERNFREKFEALNRVKLTDSEFARLLDEIVTPDRSEWAARLAWCQFTKAEMESGFCAEACGL
jgi:type I restriction enzyme R subunit